MKIEESTIGIIRKQFDLDEAADDESLFSNFREKLVEKIELLLQRDFDRLLSILYRIDVSEEKVKEVLSQAAPMPAEGLADLIIKRQLEKARSRIDHPAAPPSDDFSW